MSEERILVIEDEDATRFLCDALLRKEGYRVELAETGAAGMSALAFKRFDLVLLDLNLPDGDGLEFARRIGELPEKTPILMMTVRDRPEERMDGFESGANDYLTKPFHPGELIHRVANVIAAGQELSRQKKEERATYRFGDWTLNLESRVLESAEGRQIELTRGEFDILTELAARMGRVVDRYELLDVVARGESEGHPRTVDVLVSRIRKKLNEVDVPFEIKTAPSIGYQLKMPK